MVQYPPHHSMHGHALQQLSGKYIDVTSPGCRQSQPFSGKSKAVIAGMWLASIVALASVLAPAAAQQPQSYHLTGIISVDGEPIARPDDRAEEGRESYVIMQSSDYTIRLTYSIQSAGENLVEARFLIEREQEENWETLMQPAVQAVLGQQASVAFEAAKGSDDVDMEFVFTITEYTNAETN